MQDQSISSAEFFLTLCPTRIVNAGQKVQSLNLALALALKASSLLPSSLRARLKKQKKIRKI